MGVYSMTNRETELTAGIIECMHEPGLEGAYAIVAESEANYNKIMQAVGVAELAVFESTGEEMVYEAADVKGFFGKVKEFFVNLWEKIKGLFKKFFAMFDSYVKSDKDFVNKYKKHLLTVNTRDFKYKGYNFDVDAIELNDASSKIDGIIGKYLHVSDNKAVLDKLITEMDDRTELLEKIRGAAIGESSLEAGEFTKELFSKFRSGEDSKEELDNVSVSDLLLNISGSSKLKTTAEKEYKVLEKEIKEAMKNLDKTEKELLRVVPDKNDSDATELRATQIKVASNAVGLLKDKMSILQLINGAKLTAIKDCNRQSKAICTALMTYKPKNESYDFTNESAGFLAGVTIR